MRIPGWGVQVVSAAVVVFGLTVFAQEPPAGSNSIEPTSGGFDGDAYSDLVVGVIGERIAGIGVVGAVNVIYGSGSGLTAAGNQLWDQESAGILGDPEPGDSFGGSLAVGDFNGDRYADVAIGIPKEEVGGWNTGAVQVLYGAPGGLSAIGNQLWSQDSPNVLDPAEPTDYFGCAVAAGDFDGDGFDDLAVGVEFEDFGTASDAGAVNVLYGSAAGITADGNIILNQNLAGTEDVAETGDVFGNSLVSGDFNGDGFADLAVGVRGESIGSISGAGAVHVFFGSATGIDPTDDWFIHQDTAGMVDFSEDSDDFGHALAAGDFDGDGHDDLAIGISREAVGTVTDAGAVAAVFGSAAGLTTTGNQYWHQDVPGMEDSAEEYDYFGNSLAAGDFDQDGFADLAVGIVGEDASSGAVQILYGGVGGLDVARNWIFDQDTTGMLDDAEYGDGFGFALAVGSFDGDRYPDLAIGISGEDLGAVQMCGAVSVVHGSVSGLVVDGNQFWHQDSPGIVGESGTTDGFGRALASRQSSHLFADDLETGDTTVWSYVSP